MFSFTWKIGQLASSFEWIESSTGNDVIENEKKPIDHQYSGTVDVVNDNLLVSAVNSRASSIEILQKIEQINRVLFPD